MLQKQEVFDLRRWDWKAQMSHCDAWVAYIEFKIGSISHRHFEKENETW